eukprot:15065_1
MAILIIMCISVLMFMLNAQVTIHMADNECASQYKNLGTFSSADLCAVTAFSDSACIGNEIMYSSYAPSWGCRCCTIGTTYTSHPNWDVFKYHVVLSLPDSSCVSQTKNLGTFSSVKLCADIARPDPLCVGNEIMYSRSYPSWGCRCCVVGTAYGVNTNWDVYFYPDLSLTPTISPSKSPSKSPTKTPTQSPSKYPTISPSKSPTKSPTKTPSMSPSKYPTISPSKSPTKSPTKTPSMSPSKYPT